MQKMKLIAEFSKFMKQNINDNDMNIHILQGDLEIEKWFIKSVNNLITYKGFVLPKYFYVYGTIPIKHLNYFSWGDYSVDELENIVNTFVFTKKFTITKPFTRVYLPLDTTIIKDFNLSCIFENKLSSRTCNYYLDDFLDSFFVYNISKDYEGIKSIFAAIQKNEVKKWRFCQWLSKYLLYANDYSETIENLFWSCGQNYADLFKRTTLFMEIQTTLDNQTFDKISYKDETLNAYKLLSYQQQIYQDFLINKVDTYKISTYLDFVRELMKKGAIAPFYKDEIYRYNNKYLSLALEKISYQSTIFAQNLGSSKIASLLTTINTLNEGEPMLGFAWLNTEVQNKTLITQKTISTWATDTISVEERIQKRLANIAYLTIDKKSISNTTIDIIGYLKFISPDKTENIKSHIIMEYSNDILLVKSIELQNKASINDVIKNLLLIQDFSIGELYSYLSKNLVFYEQENAPISTSTDLCPSISALRDLTVVSCANTKTVIEKNNIRYTFTIKNGWLDDITVSDTTIENLIKTSYSSIIGKTYSIIDAIQAIVNYEAPATVREWTTNAIVVFEKIQQYLGIKTNDIADKEGKILVDITLWGINFIVNYTVSTNTMWPRYFKDIFLKDKPYPIQNLNLTLDDAHQNTINSFVIDPLGAIKSTDLTAWQNYQERLKKE